MKFIANNKTRTVIFFFIMIVIVLIAAYINSSRVGKLLGSLDGDGETVITLPKPQLDGQTSVEKAIHQRRSIRDYKNEALDLNQVSQLLWSLQGITNRQGFRTAPSAGALYPLRIYVLVMHVNDLEQGIYYYYPKKNSIKLISKMKDLKILTASTDNQGYIFQAPAVFIIAADYAATIAKYGATGKKYVHMEAGHAAQNLYLQAVSLGFGTVSIGTIKGNLNTILHLPKDQEVLYLMPVGKI